MKDFFKDKAILVTGACGTIGASLINKLLTSSLYGPSAVIGIDNNESELFFLDQKYIDNGKAHFYLVDIRDELELKRRMRGVDIVFHCAAFKHVILCERSPDEAVLTNIKGVQNIIAAAEANGVGRVIFTSSDKAVNPTNVMGTTKLMGERLMTAANSNKNKNGPIFASTRFGNVLGSNGSVVQIFHNQIAAGSNITLTDPDMTRFVMSVEDAVDLIINSAFLAQGGEVFITKMPVVRIKDLAQAMIYELAPTYGFIPNDIKISIIGAKPGEKLYEELMSDEEMRRAVELTNYFSVLPAFRGMHYNINYDYSGTNNQPVSNPYISKHEKYLDIIEIRNMLFVNGLLKTPNKAVSIR